MKTAEIEIIGNGYGKDVSIGESYLHENVINMWDFPPKGAFVYYSGGIRMTLQELTKISEGHYKSRTLSVDEITPEIREALIKKGATINTTPINTP